jgi:hypothetical protein
MMGWIMMAIGVATICATVATRGYDMAFLILGGVSFIVIGFCGPRDNS